MGSSGNENWRAVPTGNARCGTLPGECANAQWVLGGDGGDHKDPPGAGGGAGSTIIPSVAAVMTRSAVEALGRLFLPIKQIRCSSQSTNTYRENRSDNNTPC